MGPPLVQTAQHNLRFGPVGACIYICICIHIYIYMAVTSIGGQKKAKISKNPQFCSQEWPTKTATKSWRFCCGFGFSFFSFFVFFSLFLLISCCFMTSWNPKPAHQMRLQAYIYIYIYIHTYIRRLAATPAKT